MAPCQRSLALFFEFILMNAVIGTNYVDHVSTPLYQNFVLYGASSDSIYSLDGNTWLVMQGDGNLVLYTRPDSSSSWTPQWATYTNPLTNAFLSVQWDGNMVLYDSSWVSQWNSGSWHDATDSPNHLVVSNGGYAYLLNTVNEVIWYTDNYIPPVYPTFAPPTAAPSPMPTPDTPSPTPMPTDQPTTPPTPDTPSPTPQPTDQPTQSPTPQTATPTATPSSAPSIAPTNYPSYSPSNTPSSPPSNSPSSSPSPEPTFNPTYNPTNDGQVDNTETTEIILVSTTNGGEPNNNASPSTMEQYSDLFIIIGVTFVAVSICVFCLIIAFCFYKKKMAELDKKEMDIHRVSSMSVGETSPVTTASPNKSTIKITPSCSSQVQLMQPNMISMVPMNINNYSNQQQYGADDVYSNHADDFTNGYIGGGVDAGNNDDAGNDNETDDDGDGGELYTVPQRNGNIVTPN